MSEQPTVTPVGEQEQKPPFGMDYREWFGLKAKLAAKKSAVMAAVDSIPKNGYNAEHGYHFAKDADINDALRKLLHENKLDFDIEFLNRYHKGNVMEVMLLMTWTDCETGYFESRKWLAAGFDTVDKGIYKSYTGGAKYFLMRTFLMSQGDTDPEYTERGASKQKTEAPDGLPVRDINDEPQATVRQTSNRANKKAQENKGPDKPAEEAQPAEIATQEPEEGKDNVKVEEALEGHSEAAQQQEEKPEGIMPEQVKLFNEKLIELAMFSDDRNKKAAQEAVFAALSLKKELIEWGERIKRATANGERIAALTKQEADKAMEYMTAWAKDKAKRRGKADA